MLGRVGRAVAGRRAGRAGCHPPRPVRAVRRVPGGRHRAVDRGAGHRRHGVLRGHPGRRPVAGLHPRGPAAGRPVQRHAGAHLRPDDRHADPVRRPAAGPGPGQGRGGRAADRVRRRHPGQRLDLRRDPAHRAPPARVGRVPDGGGPGQGHPDARPWLHRGRGVRPAAGDLADPARQGHRRGRDHHQGAPLGQPARHRRAGRRPGQRGHWPTPTRPARPPARAAKAPDPASPPLAAEPGAVAVVRPRRGSRPPPGRRRAGRPRDGHRAASARRRPGSPGRSGPRSSATGPGPRRRSRSPAAASG